MFKIKITVFALLLFMVFAGCGVETKSSDLPSLDDGTNITDPADVNTTDPADVNTTDPADVNTTDPADVNTTEPVVDIDYGPSTYDPQACLVGGGYNYISDNSFDPDGYYDEPNGVGVTSYYPKTFNASESEVRLYHPGLDGSLAGSAIFFVEDRYSFSYDVDWVNNVKNIFYIKSPVEDDGKYFCFRYKLNSVNKNEIERVLVHNSI